MTNHRKWKTIRHKKDAVKDTQLTIVSDETPRNRFDRRWREEFVPLRDDLQFKIQAKKKELEEELEKAQKVCEHVDNGGMFYSVCKLCGLTGD